MSARRTHPRLSGLWLTACVAAALAVVPVSCSEYGEGTHAIVRSPDHFVAAVQDPRVYVVEVQANMRVELPEALQITGRKAILGNCQEAFLDSSLTTAQLVLSPKTCILDFMASSRAFRTTGFEAVLYLADVLVSNARIQDNDHSRPVSLSSDAQPATAQAPEEQAIEQSDPFVSGAAVLATEGAQVYLDGTVIARSAAVEGGGIALFSSLLEVNKGGFIDNNAQKRGGALFMDESSALRVTGRMSVCDNKAPIGALMYLGDNCRAIVSMTCCDEEAGTCGQEGSIQPQAGSRTTLWLGTQSGTDSSFLPLSEAPPEIWFQTTDPQFLSHVKQRVRLIRTQGESKVSIWRVYRMWFVVLLCGIFGLVLIGVVGWFMCVRRQPLKDSDLSTKALNSYAHNTLSVPGAQRSDTSRSNVTQPIGAAFIGAESPASCLAPMMSPFSHKSSSRGSRGGGAHGAGATDTADGAASGGLSEQTDRLIELAHESIRTITPTRSPVMLKEGEKPISPHGGVVELDDIGKLGILMKLTERQRELEASMMSPAAGNGRSPGDGRSPRPQSPAHSPIPGHSPHRSPTQRSPSRSPAWSPAGASPARSPVAASPFAASPPGRGSPMQHRREDLKAAAGALRASPQAHLARTGDLWGDSSASPLASPLQDDQFLTAGSAHSSLAKEMQRLTMAAELAHSRQLSGTGGMSPRDDLTPQHRHLQRMKNALDEAAAATAGARAAAAAVSISKASVSSPGAEHSGVWAPHLGNPGPGDRPHTAGRTRTGDRRPGGRLLEEATTLDCVPTNSSNSILDASAQLPGHLPDMIYRPGAVGRGPSADPTIHISEIPRGPHASAVVAGREVDSRVSHARHGIPMKPAPRVRSQPVDAARQLSLTSEGSGNSPSIPVGAWKHAVGLTGDHDTDAARQSLQHSRLRSASSGGGVGRTRSSGSGCALTNQFRALSNTVAMHPQQAIDLQLPGTSGCLTAGGSSAPIMSSSSCTAHGHPRSQAVLVHELELLRARELPLLQHYTLTEPPVMANGGTAVVQFATSRLTLEEVAIKFYPASLLHTYTRELALWSSSLKAHMSATQHMVPVGSPELRTQCGFELPSCTIMERGLSLAEWAVAVADDASPVSAAGSSTDPAKHQFMEFWQALAGVASLLKDLHASGWMHGNLKPTNVLLKGGDAPAWTLVDFASAAALGSKSVITFSHYSAPEIVEAMEAGELDLAASPAGDIWALGITAIELFTRQPIFQADTPGKEICDRILGRSPMMWEDSKCPDRHLKQLQHLKRSVLQCLERNPKKRPAADVLLAQWMELFEQVSEMS